MQPIQLASAAAAIVALVPLASAQTIMVIDDTSDRVMTVSDVDGTVGNPAFVTLHAGSGAGPGAVVQALATTETNGEVWVTDQTADVVHRWRNDGLVWHGEFGHGCDDIRGIHTAFGRIWICNAGAGGAGYGPALVELDLGFNFLQAHPLPGTPFGITELNGELLVSDTTNDDILRVDPATGALLGVFHDSDGVNGVDSPGQLSVTAAGNVLAVGLDAPFGVFEYAPSGAQLAYVDTTAALASPQGVLELLTGELLIGAADGLWRYNRAAGTYVHILPGIDARCITPFGGIVCSCGGYCNPNPNSTGLGARMSAFGSSSIAANDVTLYAGQLPTHSFGFFLASRQRATIVHPGGSQGILCLGGNIGRYVGPGQIQNSGSTGMISLRIDVTQLPTSNGFVAAAPGEDWNFTAWYRDANPSATSNFSEGVTVTFFP